MRIRKRRASWLTGAVFLALNAAALGAVWMCLTATARGIDGDAIARWLHP